MHTVSFYYFIIVAKSSRHPTLSVPLLFLDFRCSGETSSSSTGSDVTRKRPVSKLQSRRRGFDNTERIPVRRLNATTLFQLVSLVRRIDLQRKLDYHQRSLLWRVLRHLDYHCKWIINCFNFTGLLPSTVWGSTQENTIFFFLAATNNSEM